MGAGGKRGREGANEGKRKREGREGGRKRKGRERGERKRKVGGEGGERGRGGGERERYAFLSVFTVQRKRSVSRRAPPPHTHIHWEQEELEKKKEQGIGDDAPTSHCTQVEPVRNAWSCWD